MGLTFMWKISPFFTAGDFFTLSLIDSADPGVRKPLSAVM